MLRFRIALVTAVLSFPLPALAAEYWVDQSAAAGGDGTQAKPFQAIGDAIPLMMQGDTLWIGNGTYAETPNFYNLPGSGARTYVRAAAGATPVIDGGGSGDYVVQAATPQMTFQGLHVRNGGVGFEFYMTDAGQVIDCTTEATGTAVEFYYSSHGYVFHSDLTGSVAGKGTDGTIIESNRIHDSGAEGITLHDNSTNCKYIGNVVYDNTSVNIYLDSCSHMVVDGNLVYMSGDPPAELAGIQLADESYPDLTGPVLADITISNNIIFNAYYGIVFWQGDFPGQSALNNVVIENNTVLDSKSVAITWDPGPHQGSIVRNNVFASTAGVGDLLLVAKSTSGVTLDHDLWSLPGVQEPFNWGGSTTYDHAGWVAASQQGAGDVLADPKLAGAWSLPATNLALADGSPAIDTGATVSLDHDYLGNVRPFGSGFDLGAFEFGAPPAPDGGTPPPPPGGSETASGATSGTGAGGSGAANGETSGQTGGCGCGVAATPTIAPSLLALAAALALRRRRAIARSRPSSEARRTTAGRQDA